MNNIHTAQSRGQFSVPVILSLPCSVGHSWLLICFPVNHLFLLRFLQWLLLGPLLKCLPLPDAVLSHIHFLPWFNVHPLKWLLNPDPLSLPFSKYSDSHICLPAPPTSSPSTLQYPSHSSPKGYCIQFSWHASFKASVYPGWPSSGLQHFRVSPLLPCMYTPLYILEFATFYWN